MDKDRPPSPAAGSKMAEKITISEDGRSARVAGRKKKPLSQKLNPIWWFGNDAEQTVDQADWYLPYRPYWWRALCWNVRNPAQNLRAFVLGVSDKNYTVVGQAPVMSVQRNDLQPSETGWQWCMLCGGDLWVRRFFVSYCGRRVVWYLGHQPTGFFGCKLNLHRGAPSS